MPAEQAVARVKRRPGELPEPLDALLACGAQCGEGEMPLEVAKAHCMRCAGSLKKRALCPVTDCPLWPWREGEQYWAERTVTEEREHEKLPPRRWAKHLHIYTCQIHYRMEQTKRGRAQEKARLPRCRACGDLFAQLGPDMPKLLCAECLRAARLRREQEAARASQSPPAAKAEGTAGEDRPEPSLDPEACTSAGSSRLCWDCGAVIGPRQRYCADCKAKRQRDYERDKKRRQRARARAGA